MFTKALYLVYIDISHKIQVYLIQILCPVKSCNFLPIPKYLKVKLTKRYVHVTY